MGIMVKDYNNTKIDMLKVNKDTKFWIRTPGTAIPKERQRVGVLGKLDAMALSEFRALPLIEQKKLIADARVEKLLIYNLNESVRSWIDLDQRRGGTFERNIWENIGKRKLVDDTRKEIWVAVGESFQHNYDLADSETREYYRKNSKAILDEIWGLINRCMQCIEEGAPNYFEAIRLLMKINLKIIEKDCLETHYHWWTLRDNIGSGGSSDYATTI